MKRIFSFVLILALCLMLFITQVSAAQRLNWYCNKSKEHRQPPIPSEFSFLGECDGYCIDNAHGDSCEEKVVYLTFDAGYENGNVARILDTLQQNEVPGAFFVLKHLVQSNPDLIKRMVAEGHLVCNHTASHKNLSNAGIDTVREEIKALEEAFEEVTGKTMAKYFRPPEGAFSRELLENVSSLGYRTVFWSIAYADWDNNRQPSPDKALSCLLERMHNGAVLLLHPTSSTNAQILPQLIAELRAQGYRFGTLDELCGV